MGGEINILVQESPVNMINPTFMGGLGLGGGLGPNICSDFRQLKLSYGEMKLIWTTASLM